MKSKNVLIMESKNVLMAKDMAAELGVGLNFMYRQLRSGKVPARRIGDRFFISRSAWEQFLAGDNQNKTAAGSC
jgi:excisionase family DNA binding protein